MRTLPTLGVCGWLVAAAALPALSALEWISGAVAQAQQFDPPASGEPNLLQKEPLDLYLLQKEPLLRGYESFVGWLGQPSPPASSPQAGHPTTSGWLSGATDWLNSYWAEQARDWEIQRSLFFRCGSSCSSSNPGKGDFWKPGEFDRLIGPR
jgi:hypothetical protein